MASRRYLIEIDAVNSNSYSLGYKTAKFHMSIQGVSSYEFRWLANTTSAADMKVLIDDDYDRTVEVVLAGPHTAGVVMTKTLSVDLGEIREVHSNDVILESLMITNQVTGYVGLYGFQNGSDTSLPSCLSYKDCRECGYTYHCGWCDSRHLCLPLASDGKTWSKIMDCVADPIRPTAFWNANGCIDYSNCTATNTGGKTTGTTTGSTSTGATSGSTTTGATTTGSATKTATTKSAGNTIQYGIVLILVVLSMLF